MVVTSSKWSMMSRKRRRSPVSAPVIAMIVVARSAVARIGADAAVTAADGAARAMTVVETEAGMEHGTVREMVAGIAILRGRSQWPSHVASVTV